jgi:hypothetical protein
MDLPISFLIPLSYLDLSKTRHALYYSLSVEGYLGVYDGGNLPILSS